MASIWSRNKIWGGTFTTDVDVADGTNNASVVPASNFLGLVQGTETDPRNRSKWFSSVIGQLLRAVLHKEEDRATSANLGVSGAEPTTTKYVTVEQLPSVDKTTNDFTGTAGDGALGATQNTISISTILTGTAKQFVASLHTDFVAWLLARTWLETEIQGLIDVSTAPILPAANDYADSVLSTYLDTADSYTKTTTSNGTVMTVDVVSSGPFAFTGFTSFYTYLIRKKICTLNFKISFTVSDGAVVDLIRIPLPTGVVKDITDGENYSNYGTFYLTAPLATTNYSTGRIKSIGDGTEGQTFELRRSEQGKDFTLETSSVVTLEGFITFKVV